MANLNSTREFLASKGLLPAEAQNTTQLGAILHNLENGGLNRRQSDAVYDLVSTLVAVTATPKPKSKGKSQPAQPPDTYPPTPYAMREG